MKYFGTDGIRGIYGEGITEDTAYRAGRALARLFRGRGLIGRDTRTSGPSLESALVAGITDGGCDAVTTDVLPTPAVSHLTVKTGAAFGVMVSASHNPPEYNGIKVFLPSGGKLPLSVEEALEYYMDNISERSECHGRRIRFEGGRGEYFDSLTETAAAMGAKLGCARLDGLRVMLDCGGGAATGIAREVFEALGATVGELCSECRGECINVRCGALHPERMAEAAARGYDIGLSFDGDADRLVVWHRRVLGGDEVMLNLARLLTPPATVVGTVMANSALERTLTARGYNFVRTAVGDRCVGEVMAATDASLGGEPSGHFILGGQATGDGVLSGIAVSLLLMRGGLESLELDAQKLVSVPASPAAMASDAVRDAINEARKLAGRVVVRMSGTEPLMRIMAEGGDTDGAIEVVRRVLV